MAASGPHVSSIAISGETGLSRGNYTPIPQPPTIPLLRNALQIDKKLPYESFRLLHRQYGEIYLLELPGSRVVFLNSHRLTLEALDENTFHKAITGGLLELRGLVGDALFTAHHGEHNWEIAHRILTPAFSPANIKGMFGDMFDIASQLVLKWERYGPEHIILPAEDFTRLAFDTVALCTMGYRVNSFYNDAVQPFIVSMADYLLEAQRRATIPSVVKALSSTAKWDADRALMNEIVSKVITDRRRSGTQRGDLLDLMLHGKDPKTGELLSEENIRYQAGQTCYLSLAQTDPFDIAYHIHDCRTRDNLSPASYAKVREEVDRVLQGKPIQPEHLSKLPYIVAVMREALRLHPPAPVIAVTPYEDTILCGEYLVPKGTIVVPQIARIQRDPAVWGEDAEKFKPERMLDGKFEDLPPKAWIPFGNGARACIGRPFAWQEAIIALATLFQRFDFVMADERYNLTLKQTLTIKPDNFHIRAIPRDNAPPLVIGATSAPKPSINVGEAAPAALSNEEMEKKVPMAVLYGSNTGSSEAFAQRIASAAASNGFNARIATLDAATGHLPTIGPTVIITASFEGEPADNAGRFVQDLTTMNDTPLEGVSYAVFGCGNRDWALTYQRIPKLIDEKMEAAGAKRLLERGEGDAAGAEFFDSFDAWEVKLWETLSTIYHTTSTNRPTEEELVVKLYGTGMERAISLRQPDAALGKVVENRILTSNAEQEKRHIEFELPENMTYNAGDYLAILPTNPPASVRRVFARYKLSEEAMITINASGATTLPTGRPVELKQVLSGYVELSQPASKRNLETLIEAADEAVKPELRAMASAYKDTVVDKRISVLDILCKYPTLPISLGVSGYAPGNAINSPAISGTGEIFQGVASNFLANLRPGDLVQLMIRQSATTFSLPVDPGVPIVLFCAGTGLAPMRGFIQERAMQIQSGRKDIGKILLFFGCRDPGKDYLYFETDLGKWIELGVVDVRPAFSRAPEKSEGCRYVQDRIMKDGDEVRKYFQEKAKFFTCGGTAVAAGVREACIKLIEEGCGSRDGAVEKFKALQKERYATDIFG
ncbi:Bifunctional cytochrome P450/NADPH--P450 reductase 2 {ECO:0000305} AltName: Full=CYP102A3 {ECO:0000303/PubMed:15122913}; AltName: Full=Fatty acid hydroxylase CypB {ECO:0000305}; AltName: Full=Flavocytochrome P450 102A3 {ECO:0000305}; Includes: RecName: Full=Cytochrome P450 102A3 {ECO:0000305}; {ECO:0000269/PubMed:14741768, ECO:0000269/PubMed:15122913}; Includes: RecName: Full=NADPH--cytochrome P450 reductase; {ECO:0000269/PubMed:14741768, ECO:0000269/PubMed:15122913} [Serendipita indica DSM 11827]|nr:Bifunctional cytochrome P450/NADPH--P450 reductase 2 {ECO:0000305} AltName: Full=CYP102A3 {ECO:0000303/PubMed:15122913}; AltName: Full=Fatty acid hydroxylase CypB {ECO:0000305}; AltName: Full=Flavocytochrome P450 102A3 {ECO:0000305}; Includes: RecName: Full=Cytochrome P450 102A3 {ECO:0000305}; {ECO:0000269/PubMed:14741768, ECO:0000269/PubMed:15122913}; Includes: RecName: Full=NADPH--cytochrome P450 reductase; {ECO:0000269/PubMed:14741768, ECO:0000269/PubMed:15122913} [Serendipita indica DSM 1182